MILDYHNNYDRKCTPDYVFMVFPCLLENTMVIPKVRFVGRGDEVVWVYRAEQLNVLLVELGGADINR